jgi:hypothetical protein
VQCDAILNSLVILFPGRNVARRAFIPRVLISEGPIVRWTASSTYRKCRFNDACVVGYRARTYLALRGLHCEG